MPGSGLHDVAMGDKRSAPNGAAQGILWLGRHALHVHCAVMDRRIAWHRGPVEISTPYGQAVRQGHIIGPLPNRRSRHAIGLGE